MTMTNNIKKKKEEAAEGCSCLLRVRDGAANVVGLGFLDIIFI
jgi:hypothetical protein